MKTMKNIQRGFSLVTAIFLLVVLSGLGAVMMTFFTAQQQSSALDVLGARAYQASRAGIEWGAYQVLPNSAVVGGFAERCRPPTGAASQVLPVLAGMLSSFTVTVGCTATAHSEAAATVTVYQVSSVAATQGLAAGQLDYVERQMSVTIAQ